MKKAVFCLFYMLLLLSVPSRAGTVTTEHVQASLLAHAPAGIASGKQIWLGLAIDHQPEWHTYWKNPGDSGLATTLNWTLPPGASSGPIAWPAPQQLRVGPLLNYGYEGKLLLPVPLTLPAQIPDSGIDVKLAAEWLVCRVECIPESGNFTLKLMPGAPVTGDAARFEAAFAAAPKPVDAVMQGRLDGKVLHIDVTGLPPALHGKQFTVFAEEEGVIDYAAAPAQTWQDGRLQIGLPLSAQRSASPASMAFVLTPGDGGDALRISGPVSTAPAAAPAGAPQTGYALALLLAFAGGVLLNLMPCVLPILSLKVFGLLHGDTGRRAIALRAGAFTVGVVLSFLALAGLLLALRASGEQLGWGFQLQSPGFIAALAILFTVIGLNLAGVIELQGALPSALANLRSRNPLVDEFLAGVLAVLVASPCTAPFMGAAIGSTLTLPPLQALGIFAVLGLGMAAPYLLVSLWPRLARWLPGPGAWMNTFRTAMAFPMFATVVWLLWVLGKQRGVDGIAQLLGVLVVLSFALWLAAGTARSRWRTAVAAGSLAAAVFLAWPAASTTEWQPWSPDAVAKAQSAGQPVFVDFTAAWCITCQFNKRGALADAAVLDSFKASKVLLLRADWTARDERISAELTKLGRSGVPVYALYEPGRDAPRLLPEILSVDIVRAALSTPSVNPKESP